ncbi:MAG: hypothetical protein V1649_03755 [Patescibacteria group bacterium]
MTKKFILIFSSVVLTLGLVVYFLPNITTSWRWQKAVEASASFPYQIGLTNAIIIPCVLTPAGLCAGGPLCLDPVRCILYSDVSGIPAGGTGSNGLFLKTAIIKAGLTPGGQLIAGGMSPVFMDSGVLASAGGCFGCIAKANFTDKIFNWIDKYIIAGFTQSKK